MIATIIIVTLALIWLGFESDWLRVNLCEIPEVYQHVTWDEIRAKFGRVNRSDVFWLRFPENMEPLCGWDYLRNTQHIVPTYKFEIKAWNVTHKITLNVSDAKIIKDIAIAALHPSKVERRELTIQRKQAKGLA